MKRLYHFLFGHSFQDDGPVLRCHCGATRNRADWG